MCKHAEVPIAPRAVVGGLIFNKLKEILLVKPQKSKRGRYSLPTGHVKDGEGHRDALIREVHEETGVEAIVTKRDSLESFYVKDAYEPHRGKHNILYAYVGYKKHKKEGELVRDDREIEASFWIRPEQALSLDLDPFSKEAIEKLMSGHLNLNTPPMCLAFTKLLPWKK